MKRIVFLMTALSCQLAFADSNLGDGLPYIEIMPCQGYVDTQNACRPHEIVRALEDRYFKELSKGLHSTQVTYGENKVIFQYYDRIQPVILVFYKDMDACKADFKNADHPQKIYTLQ